MQNFIYQANLFPNQLPKLNQESFKFDYVAPLCRICLRSQKVLKLKYLFLTIDIDLCAAYCLLFGKYIEVGTVKNRWVVKGSFKRWWQVKLWEQFFDDMLNPKGEEKECLPSLLEWRKKFLLLFEIEDLREGLVKAREVIEIKLLEKWRRSL